MPEENEKLEGEVATGSSTEEPPETEKGRGGRLQLREIFEQAFEKARREQQPVTSKRELGRDRSRSLFLLLGAVVAVLLLFLGVFSSPNNVKKSGEAKRAGASDLGRRVTPGQQAAGQTGSVTPLLNADTRPTETRGSQGVTPEDISRTARLPQPNVGTRLAQTTKPMVKNPQQYALGRIDFSDPALAQQPGQGVSPQQTSLTALVAGQVESEDLRKPSLVFVRAAQNSARGAGPQVAQGKSDQNPVLTDLPIGTRLVARLLSAVSTAVPVPVVAAIEYNYEREGEIVVPAGAKALGTLRQADRSGNVAIHFDTLQMPDGTIEKIDATGMGLNYGLLKGNVSGKRTGTRFLVRTFTGLGTVATYLVGARGSNGFNGPLSESALLRERMATNIGIAGDQELNSLAFNQNIVVTVPGNTRFYVVLQKAAIGGAAETRPTTLAAREVSNTKLPSVEELRQLIELRRELSEMVQQSGGQSPAQQVPQP